MTSLVLCLALYGLTCFLAGCRFVTELRQRRANRYGGYLPITGGPLEFHSHERQGRRA